jgi:fructokinase
VTTSTPLFAGIELGGTKCICILASGPDDIRDEIRIDTRDPVTTLDAIHAVLTSWKQRYDLAALGIGSFGPLDLGPASPAYGTIIATPKKGWSGTDLLTRFRALNLPLALDTDVNGAALAEGRWGGARGLASYAYVTVGTGIGVGAIVNGTSITGLGHVEAGHLRIPRLPGDTWPGSCPFHGDCVEGLASGTAIEARLGQRGGTLAPDDPVWPGVAHAIAALLHNLVLTVAPQRILIGGGVATSQPHILPSIRAALTKSLGGYGATAALTPMMDAYVTPPSLGPRAGPLGAIALAYRVLG